MILSEQPAVNKARALTYGVAAISIMVCVYLYAQQGLTFALLFVIGLLLGITLFKGAFGFTGAYSAAFEQRDMQGLFAQIVMLAAATLLFAPILAQGYVFEHDVVGAVAPLSLALVIGAFVFGIGMQLGGSCASGSLFVAGAGNRRTLIVLVFFCVGAFLGSLHLHQWQALPSLEPINLSEQLGIEIALPLQLGGLALLYGLLSRYHRPAQASRKYLWWPGGFGDHSLARDTWPLMLTAMLLALLNWATLLVAGHPWSITWAFSLWGAKVAALLGWDPNSNVFWQAEFQQQALQNSVLSDETSVMNIAILLGATWAAGIANQFRISGLLSTQALTTAVIGGLCMGYGARLAYGCNIGALFSGISSTSVHGWLWIVCAIPGFWLGSRLNQKISGVKS